MWANAAKVMYEYKLSWADYRALPSGLLSAMIDNLAEYQQQ